MYIGLASSSRSIYATTPRSAANKERREIHSCPHFRFSVPPSGFRLCLACSSWLWAPTGSPA
ncbi:MAG: hypothetical protein VB124_03155 [Burkholderia sp.]